MSASPCYRMNKPLVASEIIDGEAVLIHFETGSYYSTDELGAEILSCFDSTTSVAAIVGQLAGRYDRKPELIESIVAQFVEQLRNELLIVPATSTSVESGNPPAATESPRVSGEGDFDPPVLHKYTDLQDLILLDPIHETDDAGWPIVRPDSDESKK